MDMTGKADHEIREAMGDKFPKHIYHSIICIGALVARRDNPTQCGITAVASTCAKGRHKPNISRCMPGAGLSRQMRGKVLSYMPAFQPYWGKPAVRNDREGRGNVGIIRSPVRASTLPDCGAREVTRVPTAKCARASWCDPAGASPAQVRSSVRLVASVA
jgi:hypothetical protein